MSGSGSTRVALDVLCRQMSPIDLVLVVSLQRNQEEVV